MEHPIILYDGACNLCNSLIDFISDKDKNNNIQFVELQSKKGLQILSDFNISASSTQTLFLIEGKKVHMKASAVLRIAEHLKGFYAFLSNMGGLIPPGICDSIYDTIARHRYQCFCKKDACRIPDIEERSSP